MGCSHLVMLVTKKHRLIESKKDPFNLYELDSDTDIMCSFCQCCLDNFNRNKPPINKPMSPIWIQSSSSIVSAVFLGS